MDYYWASNYTTLWLYCLREICVCLSRCIIMREFWMWIWMLGHCCCNFVLVIVLGFFLTKCMIPVKVILECSLVLGCGWSGVLMVRCIAQNFKLLVVDYVGIHVWVCLGSFFSTICCSLWPNIVWRWYVFRRFQHIINCSKSIHIEQLLGVVDSSDHFD